MYQICVLISRESKAVWKAGREGAKLDGDTESKRKKTTTADSFKCRRHDSESKCVSHINTHAVATSHARRTRASAKSLLGLLGGAEKVIDLWSGYRKFESQQCQGMGGRGAEMRVLLGYLFSCQLANAYPGGLRGPVCKKGRFSPCNTAWGCWLALRVSEKACASISSWGMIEESWMLDVNLYVTKLLRKQEVEQ